MIEYVKSYNYVKKYYKGWIPNIRYNKCIITNPDEQRFTADEKKNHKT